MSKQIDASDLSKLSEDDLQYLLDRGKITVDDIPKGKQPKTQPGDSTADTSEGPVTLDDLSASQLKAEAEQRGLPKGGSKQDLIERIQEHDAGTSDGDDDVIDEES